jgi:hypothetical protein
MPPFIGPRALSCCTRNPTNVAKLPSSLGMVHSTCGETHEQTIRPARTINRETPQATRRRGDPHLDLPERDEQALLELGVEAEQLRCPPEVAGGGGERVHRGGNFFQEEGTRITRTCCGLWPRKGAAFPAPRRRRQKQEAQARATTTTRARSGRPKKGRRRGWDEERTRRVSSEDRGGRPGREGWRSGVNRRDVLIARGIERGGGGGGGGGAGIRLEDRIDARRGAEFRLVVRGSRVK